MRSERLSSPQMLVQAEELALLRRIARGVAAADAYDDYGYCIFQCELDRDDQHELTCPARLVQRYIKKYR